MKATTGLYSKGLILLGLAIGYGEGLNLINQ
jgi:hypothetical protein